MFVSVLKMKGEIHLKDRQPTQTDRQADRQTDRQTDWPGTFCSHTLEGWTHDSQFFPTADGAAGLPHTYSVQQHARVTQTWTLIDPWGVRATIIPSHELQPLMTLWEACKVCTHSAINTCIQLSIQIPRRATTTVDNPWWWVFIITTDVACKQGFRLWSKSY